MQRRIARIREVLPKTELRDRVVIVTDDGVATGATMKAAIWAVRRESPRRTVAALPVGPADSIEDLAEAADEVICLQTPPYFAAIGQFYRRFDQVTDAELIDILQHEHDRRCEHDAATAPMRVGATNGIRLPGRGGGHAAHYRRRITETGGVTASHQRVVLPRHAANLRGNNAVAIAVWDLQRDAGYQLLGHWRIKTSLSGHTRPFEDKEVLPQVEKQLVVRVEKILDFSLAPHGDVPVDVASPH